MRSINNPLCFAFILAITLQSCNAAPAMATQQTQGPSSTRFYTETLPTASSYVTVRDSVAGNFMPSVGNGYIGTVIYSESIHVAGVFSGKANPKKKPVYPVYFYEHAHRARIPSSCALELDISDVDGGKSSYALDVKEGVFYRWYSAEKFHLEQRIYAHRSKKHILVVEITATNGLGKPVNIKINNKRGNDSLDIEFTEVKVEDGLMAAIGKVNITETDSSIRPEVAVAWTPVPSVIKVKETKEDQTWYFITAIATSLDTKYGPLSEAVSQWDDANRTTSNLLESHKEAWKYVWDSGDIDIEGDLDLSQAVSGSMYYILSSIRSDWPYGLSPGSLSGGEEYMGHTFWDMDIWMYPFLVLLYPDLARSALTYRYERLPAARRIARKYGYKGAMFPWESAFTGLETSPGERYGKNQNHITGDIAHAAKLYWWVTKDTQWLRQNGYELAKQTAEFWVSRVQYRSDVDLYVINHVMPPDEYHYPVNNSVYTNVVAKLNLEFAIKVYQVLGLQAPDEWLKISRLMIIPFDEHNQYHPEYEGYNLNITAKQADTILIGYPLMYEMDTEVRSNDLRLYEERTDPDGPAMTHSMFAIGWLELGQQQRAQKPFTKNFENIKGPFKVWVEHRKPSGQVNFITGAGGFLQTILYGYGGFRIHSNHLAFNPTLPPNSTVMTIRGISYLGNKLSFKVSNSEVFVSVVAVDDIAPSLEIVSRGKTFLLEKDAMINLPKGNGIVRMRGKPTVSSSASRGLPVNLCVFLTVLLYAVVFLGFL